MNKTPITITIILMINIIIFGWIIINIVNKQIITQATCVVQCKEVIKETQINEKAILLNACRIICKENIDCKANCLNGTLVEADI